MNLIGEFLSWWFAQLGEFLPKSTSAVWNGRKTTVSLSLKGNRFTVTNGDAEHSLELPPHGVGMPATEVEQLRSMVPASAEMIEMTLAPGDYLSNHLSLPRAARAHLAETVGYQLPQLTPFNAEQLLYACGENPGIPGDDKLSVWLIAVPKRRVEQALATISQAPPGNPLSLDRPPVPGSPLTISWRSNGGHRQGRRSPRLAWWLLGLLFVGVAGLHLYQLHQTKARLADDLDGQRIQAAKVLKLQNVIDDSRAQADWLSGKVRNTVTPLKLLDTLSREIDDETWLQRLELRGERLTLVGFSPAPAALIEKLENSQVLEDVKFSAAITRDARGQGDRFNVSARVRPAPPGDGS